MNDFPPLTATGTTQQQRGRINVIAADEVNINVGGLVVSSGVKFRFEAVVQENVSLRGKVEKLEKTVNDFNGKILELIQKCEISEKAIQELQKENEFLKSELIHQKNKELIKLYSVAIIDLVKDDDLLKQIDPNLVDALTDLNDGRVDDCHYINKKDSEDLKNYKKAILYQKLKGLSPDLLYLFDQVYDKRLIDEFIMHLENFPPPVVNVDQRAQNRIKLFWND